MKLEEFISEKINPQRGAYRPNEVEQLVRSAYRLGCLNTQGEVVETVQSMQKKESK